MGQGVLRRYGSMLLALVCLAAVALGAAGGYRYAFPRYSGPPLIAERVEAASTSVTALNLPSLEEEIQRETSWLLACQMPDGAIAQTPLWDKVVPYFANLAAKTLVGIEPSRARRYMTWYFEHLNRPDRFGLSGTVYDYELGGVGLVPTFGYDSADGYAATFLSLASSYLKETGDRQFIEANMKSMDLIAGVLLNLQDKDGLVAVVRGSSTKYLMDNSEAYRGLTDWAEALVSLGLPDKASALRSAAERIVEGIQETLYVPARGQYAYSLSWLGKRLPKAGRWYPDAVSQLYLISNGVLHPDDPKSLAIWEDFNAQFPLWSQGAAPDGFAWATIALTSAKMGDRDRAAEFLTWASQQFGQKARPYPWYVLESASIIDLYRELGR